MIAVGIDIIEINRIKEAVSEWQHRFLNRIYTDMERQLYVNKMPSLAGRFAAKEAGMKVLRNNRSSNWREIEVLTTESGAPSIRLYGHTRELAESMGMKNFSVSISHCQDYAVATVVSNAE